MKLSQQHIAQLYEFTQKHYVEYYDVQTELVDHLANGIEAQWEESPNLSFEEALNKEFKKFGVFGFMDVVSQTEKSMGRQYRRFLYSEVKKWFKIPQIISTFCLGVLFFLIFKSDMSGSISLGLYVILGLWISYKTFALKHQFKKRQNASKKLLLEQIIFQQASGVLLVALLNVFNLFNLSNNSGVSNFEALLISLLFTLAVIVSIVSLHVLPNKADELIKQTYPTFVTN